MMFLDFDAERESIFESLKVLRLRFEWVLAKLLPSLGAI